MDRLCAALAFVCAVCASAPAFAGESAPAAHTAPVVRPKAIVLDLRTGAATEEVARVAANLLAVELSRNAQFDVVTSADLRQQLEREGTRVALGCTDDSASCMAEVAGALGVSDAFYGDVARLGSVYIVTLNHFDAAAGRAVGRVAIEITDVGDLPPRVREAIPVLLGAAPSAGAWPLAATGTVGLVGAAVGAVAVLGGAGWALRMANIEGDPASSSTDKQLALQTHDPAGAAALIGLGVVVVGAGLLVWDVLP